jgi:hypothetical protein
MLCDDEELLGGRMRNSKPLMLLLWVIAALVALSGCGESAGSLSGTKGKSIEVTRASWHDGKWPFSVSHGILGCHTPPFPGAVTFNVDGMTYWINGDAGNVANEEHYEDVHPIWLKEPSSYGGEELRVNIGGIISRGLRLCEEAKGEKE